VSLARDAGDTRAFASLAHLEHGSQVLGGNGALAVGPIGGVQGTTLERERRRCRAQREPRQRVSVANLAPHSQLPLQRPPMHDHTNVTGSAPPQALQSPGRQTQSSGVTQSTACNATQ